MTQVNEVPVKVEEVVVTHEDGSEHSQREVRYPGARISQVASKISQFIWLVFGILEVLIGIRVVLRLAAANLHNQFAILVNTFTDIFLRPFFGLFGAPAVGGRVLEITSIIAMFVYALIAWVLVKLVRVILDWNTTRVTETYDKDTR